MEGAMTRARTVLAAVALTAAVALPAVLRAQPTPPQPPKPEMVENCPGLVARGAPRILPASLKSDQVRINYVGHSTFLIESPRGMKIATDYNDYVKPRVLPDIVTMNYAHSTHYTDSPEPGIKHVLRGWGPSPERPARHDLNAGDVRVRNVPTNIRSYISGGTERHGNSIFIFEIANMCIAHLGHLHHTLNQQQLNEMGRVDVVLFPVDGGVTLDHEGMVEVLKSLKAPLVVPMHFFSTYSLRGFMERMKENAFETEIHDVGSMVVSKTTLPAKPTMRVLPGRMF
jgi:L-ascorbate metabolism protein UlaG (beta-lactamase superfamily)